MIDNLLSDLGFSTTKYVEGRSSIADLYRRNRCGIYVLHFANGQYYVGQTEDVVRRYAQHRHNHTDIQKISLKRASKKHLNEDERTSIRAFEACGCQLRNIQIVTVTYGETDFDLVMPRTDQTRWLNDLTFQDLDGSRVVNPHLRQQYAKSYQHLLQLPYADEVIQVLREYVQNTIPAVKRGEITHWMCSCLPGNSNSLYSRINVGWQTAFEVFVIQDKPVFYWYLTKPLAEQIFGRAVNRIFLGFERHLRTKTSSKVAAWVGNSRLVAGGPNQAYICMTSIPDAFQFIHDKGVLSVMRQFNIGLAQKSPCPWGRNHCLDLADRLIE